MKYVALSNKFESLNDQVSELLRNNQLKAVESQITAIADQNQAAISDLTTKVDAIAKDVSSNSTQLGSLKNQLDNIEASVVTLCQLIMLWRLTRSAYLLNNSVSSITVGVVDKQKEQEKRKLNLIFHIVT